MIKRGNLSIRKILAIPQLFILVLSMFAVSFIFSQTNFVTAEDPPTYDSAPPVKPGANTGVGSGSALAKYTSVATANLAKVVSAPNGNFLIREGKLIPGDVSAINLNTGQQVTLTLDDGLINSAKTATPVQSAFGAKSVIINGQQTSLANALSDNTLRSELIKNPALLNEHGLTLTEASNGGYTLTQVNGGATTTYNALGEQIASSGKLAETNILGVKFVGGWAHLVDGLIWVGLVVGAIQLIGSLAGLDDTTTNALSLSAVGGIMSYKGILAAAEEGFIAKDGLIASNAGLIGIGVAVAIFVLTYKKEKKKLITFQCLPFEPMIGGAKCEVCNKDPFRPCSEYRCKALGQACNIVNKGTIEEKCVWINPKDVTSPTISPRTEALKPAGLSYVPDSTIRPPNRGVKIVKGTDCLQAFTPLEFGVTTNEPAQCKLDFNRNSTFNEMKYYFGESNYFLNNHTQKMALPSPDKTQAELLPELQNDGTFNLFVKCQDANGNVNEDAFVFNFCVDESPDTTPPIIKSTSINSGSPVQFNADKVPIEVYVNEPAQCKWSREIKPFEDMENSMNCNTGTFQINSDLTYTCKSDLTGIKNREQNKFYFRCKDQPEKPENERNVNTQSYELILRGSQSLNIIKTAPNGTISGSTEVVTISLDVETDDGANEGKSICYFSNTNVDDSFIAMFETNNFKHKQSLDLPSGDYEYFFKCIDAGGNTAENSTKFKIDVDKRIPAVTRAYKEEGLKIVTDEDAQCTYSLKDCNFVFNEGLQMIYSNPNIKNVHFAEWKTNNVYHVKCRDLQGNEPSPNECSIVVRATEIEKSSKK